jgi:hypothetical protein
MENPKIKKLLLAVAFAAAFAHCANAAPNLSWLVPREEIMCTDVMSLLNHPQPGDEVIMPVWMGYIEG